MVCKKGTVELCSIGDDANGLYRRMAAADLVLIAAPVFCWGFPAQIKGLIDRMYCMMDFDGERPNVPRLRGKSMALLLTGGGGEANNADLVIAGFQQLVEWVKGRIAGHWFVGGCTKPEAIGDEVKSCAVAFAKRLIDRTK
jgi:multimeric flavodoxin WrbA